MSEPSVYDFADYRAFVRAWLGAKPSRSMRGTAPQAGVSVALFSAIVNAKRSMDLSRIPAFARALRLDEDEAAFFADLVAQEHAGTEELRAAARERVAVTRTFRGVRAIDIDSWEMIGHLRHAAILELSQCADWQDDPEWVAARLRIPCTPEQASASLELLERIGAMRREPDGGRVASGVVWSTGHSPDERLVASALTRLHHTVLDTAHAALDELPGPRRRFGTLTFAVSSARLPELEARVRRFQEEVIHFAEQCAEDADTVWHLGTQLYPLVHPMGNEGEEPG